MTDINKRSKLHVEGILPKEFLYDLGTYLQTCAHIELVTAALVVCLKGELSSEDDWYTHYSRIRKLPTKDLIKKLRSSANAAVEFGFNKDLLVLCDWLTRFTSNRHIAVHGAFFCSKGDFLRVDYPRNTGSKNEPNYTKNREAITKEVVSEAVLDADRIYLILLGMIGKIENRLPITVHRHIVPVVSSPH